MKREKKYVNILGILLVLLIVATIFHANNITFAESSTQSIEDGIYIIKSALNEDYVLDITESSKENGGNLELWSNGETDNQKFKVKYIGDGCYNISVVHSEKYIDVEGNSKVKGANILQWQYHGGDNQKWIIKDAGNGTYNIISKSNNLYLDVPESKAENGTNIQVWSESGANNQKFKFERQDKNNDIPQGTQTISDGVYSIKSALDNKYVLEITASSLENGGNLEIWTNGSTANQKFNVKYLGNGYYTLQALHSEKYIDVPSSEKKAGTNLAQWQYFGGDNQQWVIRDAGDGYYNIISKCNGLYVDITQSKAANGTNVGLWTKNDSENQKFKFEKPVALKGTQTIEDGTYIISSALNNSYVIDVPGSSKNNGESISLWRNGLTDNQRFNISYIGDGYYTIKAVHSGKALEVANGSTIIGTKVTQYTENSADAQKWIIKDAGDGYYNIISKNSELYMEVVGGDAKAGADIAIKNRSWDNDQKFKFRNPYTLISIDDNKYPGYKDAIEKLMIAHPNWNFEILYTRLKFNDAVSGESAVHSRNLVETNYGGEWICPTCGTRLYDSGWYCASEKAIAYYLDPRNFLDEVNIFQFLDVNSYSSESCTLDGIKQKVSGSFLENYENDINNACKNTNVNPYYIIARLFQEQGRKGTTIGRGMDGGDGKTYYNPFNIGASGNGYDEIYANALARAKREGWDTMQKSLEGGIYFCKANWLENYQNTLYQNRFDIDSRNGTNLYEHQYMQNLLGAYSEAITLYGMYNNTNTVDSNFTFIIPVYEQMDKNLSQKPSNSSEMYPINVKTTGTNVNLREGPNTDSNILREINDSGTILLSIERGINSNWQKVVTNDGIIGYISGTYLSQVDDVTTCNYTARVKTNDGDGCNVRVGPGIKTTKITALADGVEVIVIDNSTYKNIDGYDWHRIILSDGRQAFMPGIFLK